MELVKRNWAKKFENSDVCTAFEFPMKDMDTNGAVIEISGRYPTKARAVNLKCKELTYVVSGSGVVEIDGRKIDLTMGDLVLISPGERFFWDGTMTLFMACTPAWHPEQHKEVE